MNYKAEMVGRQKQKHTPHIHFLWKRQPTKDIYYLEEVKGEDEAKGEMQL